METVQNNENVIVPDPSQDYHGHPNYMKVFIGLMLLFSVSLVAGFLFSPMVAIFLIFATALLKTALVMRNFMHLKFEPYLILIAVAAVLFCLLAFFFGIYPDITAVTHDVAHL